jgi:hypothetical protein
MHKKAPPVNPREKFLKAFAEVLEKYDKYLEEKEEHRKAGRKRG